MSEIGIQSLVPKIIGADLGAPETSDSRDNVSFEEMTKAVGHDRVIDNAQEARAYLRYLGTHDSGSPTAITVGSWAHRTLYGAVQSARKTRQTERPRPSAAQQASRSYREAIRDAVLTNSKHHGPNAPMLELSTRMRATGSGRAAQRAFSEKVKRSVHKDLEDKRVSVLGLGSLGENQGAQLYVSVVSVAQEDGNTTYWGFIQGQHVTLSVDPHTGHVGASGLTVTEKLSYADDDPADDELPLVPIPR